MPLPLARWTPRLLVASLVAAGALLAWRDGGGADRRAPPPRPQAATSRSAQETAGHGASALEVKARLVESLGEARLDVPSLAAAQPQLDAAWRKVRGPWVHASGLAARLAYTVALRTSHGEEEQWTVPTQSGDTWVPDARVWNMNEGSFDQREALLAPTPATLAFRLTLPPRARLRFAPALLAPAASTTLFEATVIDAAGVEHALWQLRTARGEALGWTDVDVDLAAWAGQSVELVLRTSSEPASGAPAVALWGDPGVVASAPSRVPYDVLWVVVDALRPDVAASLHDADEDAARRAAPHPPLEALLPAVPGLMPRLDALAARGVRFSHAWSAGAWTRPGTLAMLSGERSSELGIGTLDWILPDRVARFYASDPPLLPRLLRRDGVSTAAFVNNFFMAGYAAVGLDMGFERVTDHRYRTRDTAEITRDALAWLDAHAGDRFFLFVNYNSPHQPYDPPKDLLARVPPPPAGPRDPQVRAYMAEGAKDDAALGVLLDELEALHLTAQTLVVVTSDHGETLSSAHDARGLDGMPLRFHHAIGNFEETARIPVVMALPGVLDGGRAVADRVRNVDIAPTVLEVEGLEADPRMSGRSMLPLARGVKEEARAVLTEGRGTKGFLWGDWRLLVTDPTADDAPDDQLFDLRDDPGERRDVARGHPQVVAEMRARLTAALANVRAADAPPSSPAGAAPGVHLRFAGAGRVRRVAGQVEAGDKAHGARVSVEPVGILRDALRVDGARADFAFVTAADGVVGLDLRVEPPGAPVRWTLYLDDGAWPASATFAGPFGLPARAARSGLADDEARAEAYAPTLPFINPAHDLGVFVTRDRPSEAAASVAAPAGAAAKEMQRVLEDWGYAHRSASSP